MTARARHAVFAAVLALSATAVGTGVAAAGKVETPVVQTQAPTAVTTTSAVLHGLVDPNDRKTTYWFELGPTTAYGTSTNPASAGSGKVAVTVNRGVDTLQPATTYHVRVVASNDRGITSGDDVTFTTPAVPREGAAAPLPIVSTPVAAARHRARARPGRRARSSAAVWRSHRRAARSSCACPAPRAPPRWATEPPCRWARSSIPARAQ